MGLQRGGGEGPSGQGSTLIIKGIKWDSSFFFTVVCVNVFSYHTDVIFLYLKLRTSPFHWTTTCTYSRFLLNSSFITVHSSDSFTLSVFLFSSCSAMACNCLGGPVFSFGRTLTLMCPLYAVQGCHLYRSILLMMLKMFQSLLSFPLHHFLSPKLKFLHAVESLSPCLIRSC